MPHQCLQCGHVFEDGSSQMLKGCPGCGGNRFYFTKQPLSAEEREILRSAEGKDIPTKIMDLAVDKNIETGKSTETWITIKPKDLRSVIKDRAEQEKTLKGPPHAEPISDEERQKLLKKIREETNHSDIPETIEVEQPGKYRINLKGLLEKEPIVINKDGAYTIHLPSVFKMPAEKRSKKRK
ncbi:MAG TPA: Zn-ribbon containing protein [Candidatus Thermoplasmatota archaeon]|nr:Zn-ribbon containing protein [Candidatus Thermoplasmatota archaeon]